MQDFDNGSFTLESFALDATMKTLKSALIARLLVLFVTPSASLYAQPKHSGPSASDQKILMKNWALSLCFAKIAKDKETKADAGRTASAYLENSYQDLEDFDKIEDLVKTFLAKTYSGSDGGTYNTMKCIDMFESDELEKLVRGFVVKNPPVNGF